MNETALDNAIVPQVPKPTLIPVWAPGIDVRMTAGPHRGKIGYIVGWHVSPLPSDRHGGWEIFIPKLGESIITLPCNFERLKHLPKWAALPELMPELILTPHPPFPPRPPMTPEQRARKRQNENARRKRDRERAAMRTDGAA